MISVRDTETVTYRDSSKNFNPRANLLTHRPIVFVAMSTPLARGGRDPMYVFQGQIGLCPTLGVLHLSIH